MIDQIALLDTLPKPLVRRVPGVRLYAPNRRYVDLEAPGYYFLATNTPAMMRWLASEAERAGATIAYDSAFTDLRRLQSGFDVKGLGPTRFLIGADGPRSRVAGGIHTALKHGLAAGNAVADFLHGRAGDPSGWFVGSYPKFRTKRLLRLFFDRFQSDLAFNCLLATWPMRFAARVVYFRGTGRTPPLDTAADIEQD